MTQWARSRSNQSYAGRRFPPPGEEFAADIGVIKATNKAQRSRHESAGVIHAGCRTSPHPATCAPRLSDPLSRRIVSMHGQGGQGPPSSRTVRSHLETGAA